MVNSFDETARGQIDTLKRDWSKVSHSERRRMIKALLALGISRRALAKELNRWEGTIRYQIRSTDIPDEDDLASPSGKINKGKKGQVCRRGCEEQVSAVVLAARCFINRELRWPPWFAMQALRFVRLRQERWHLHAALPAPDLFTDPEKVLEATRTARPTDDHYEESMHRLTIGFLRVAPFPDMSNEIIRQLIVSYEVAARCELRLEPESRAVVFTKPL